MKISYGITVCNELTEIQRLVTFLLKHKELQDDIVITYDSKNGSEMVEEYLRSHSINGEFSWHPFEFTGDFAKLKNHTKKMSSGDYIVHLDADEKISETFINQLPDILEMNNVDLIYVPRINTVDGITEQHIKQWGWRVVPNPYNMVAEKELDTESDEYKFLKYGGYIVDEEIL